MNVLPPVPPPVNVADNVSKVATDVPKFKEPKLTPVCAGEPFTKQPLVSVNVTATVPVVVTAIAGAENKPALAAIAKINRSFIVHPSW